MVPHSHASGLALAAAGLDPQLGWPAVIVALLNAVVAWLTVRRAERGKAAKPRAKKRDDAKPDA